MSDGRIIFALDGQVARITLDRPDKLNALTPAMLTALGDAVGRIDGNDDIRVVVLSATGHRAFCVGADIDAWAANGPLDMWRHWVRDGHAVFDRMARLRPPLIAAIEGLALGGGLELAATCDLRIGGAGAVFGLPEADVGVVPGWSGTQRLVREIGPAPVKLMALAGERLDAAAAERAGVLHRTVSAGTALDAALDMAARIAARATRSPCSSPSNSSTPPSERTPRKRWKRLRPESLVARRTFAKAWPASERSGRPPFPTNEQRDDRGEGINARQGVCEEANRDGLIE